MTPWMPLGDAAVDALAQTILHFVWQGFVLWALAACVLYVARAAAPQTRYAVHCLSLAVLAACPLVTFGVVFERPAPLTLLHTTSATPQEVGATMALSQRQESTAAPWMTATTALAARVEPYRNWLVSMWFAGAGVFASRLLLATVAVATIKRRRRAIAGELAIVVDRLARQLKFRSRPAVYVVEQLSQAMAVGLFKPLVLLPASWLSELPSSVLETVIAHELAHLRRWDLAINFCQRMIECALFFHPVVWWYSSRLRVEREICCDALALQAVGNRAQYAKALTYLADRRVACADSLVAAGIGGPKMVLLERIRNVLGITVQKSGRFYGVTCAASGAVITSIVWLAVLAMLHCKAASDMHDVQTATMLEPRTEPKVPQRIHTGVNSQERQTDRFMLGAQSPPAIGDKVPTEQHKMTLPDYTIEPPDILFIEASRVVPKTPDHIRDQQVSAQSARIRALQPIVGEHLVAPDGTVNLGMYGRVNVAGMTLDQAKAAIDVQLAKWLDSPDVALSVFAYNSKVYYVITEGTEGDSASRFPITGSETVLDALTQVNGLGDLSTKRIWIARPTPGSASIDTVLQVNFQQITKGAATASNYQVLPGDRVFVSDDALKRVDDYIKRAVNALRPDAEY